MNEHVPRALRMSGLGVLAVAALLWAATAGAAGARPAPAHHKHERAKHTDPTVEAWGQVTGRAVPVADASVTCPPGTKTPGAGCTAQGAPTDHGAVEVAPLAGSPTGTYCLKANGISPGHGAVMLVSVTDVPPSTPAPGSGTYLGLRGAPYAAWVPGGTSCGAGQFEVQTAETTTGPGGLTVTPSGYVSFSFLIVGST